MYFQIPASCVSTVSLETRTEIGIQLYSASLMTLSDESAYLNKTDASSVELYWHAFIRRLQDRFAFDRAILVIRPRFDDNDWECAVLIMFFGKVE